MFRLTATLLVSALFVLAVPKAGADHHAHSYPKVRTFSGGYYGPTQAHYQYQRRYGRPWLGYGGLYAGHGVGYVNGFPAGGSYSSYRSWGWPSVGYGGFGLGVGGFGYSRVFGSTFYGPGCGFSPFVSSPFVTYPLGLTVVQPTLIPESPGFYQPLPSTNPLANDALLNNGYMWGQEVPGLITPQVEPLSVEPLGQADVPLQPSSTPQAQLRSLQHQQHGDARLRNLDYLQAYLRYKDAINAAPDRAEPHYRMGIALVGMKRFDKAVREFKTATSLDPTWVDSVSLLDLLGADNLIGKTQLKQRVADWALEDAYDADRLYLLGALLHLDGDRDRARILFDTALALVGEEPHLVAFMTPPVAPPSHDERMLPPAPTDVPDESTETVPTLPPVPTPIGPAFPSEFE